MGSEKTTRQNRVREALGRLYDQQPPYFQEYLRRYKEDPKSRVFAPLAEAYRKMGRLDEALELCREGLKHHPDFHGGRVALAKCLIDKTLWPEAIAELEAVIQVAPENLLAQRLLGDAHFAISDREGALHHYRMTLLLAPADVALAEKIRALEKADKITPPVAQPTKEVPAPVEEFVVARSVEPAPVPVPEAKAQPPVQAEEILEEWELSEFATAEDEPEQDAAVTAQIDSILGMTEADEEAESEGFQIEHVSAIFTEGGAKQRREITTETLGDLYYSQGQFDKSLQIFEKLMAARRTPELQRKINACRASLGVDAGSIARNRKIDALRTILHKTRERSLES